MRKTRPQFAVRSNYSLGGDWSLLSLVLRNGITQYRPGLPAASPVMPIGLQGACVIKGTCFDAAKCRSAIVYAHAAFWAECTRFRTATLGLKLELFEMARNELKGVWFDDEAHAKGATRLALTILAMADIEPNGLARNGVSNRTALTPTLHPELPL